MTNVVYLAVGAAIGLVGLWVDYRWYRVLHSVLFIVILFPLSIFVVSSTGNTIGQGLVAALDVGLLVEMAMLYRSPEVFNQHFGGAQKPLTEQEIKVGVLAFAVLTVVVLLLLGVGVLKV